MWPVKRSPLLIELSREHHAALVLATRLMPQGNAGYHAKLPGTAAERVVYLREQFAMHLSPHFGVEERAFALLAPGRAELESAITRMLDDHREMRLTIQNVDSTGDDSALARFGRLLVGHVRFEERTLFPAVASQGNATELAGISDILSHYSQPGT